MAARFLLLERLHKPSINLIDSPRKLAFALDLFSPKFLDRRLAVAWQFPERISSIGIQIEIVARRFFRESNIPPQIRIDGMLHDEIPMLFEKRPDCDWKYIDGTGCDKAMNVKPPGRQRPRNQQSTQQQGYNETGFHRPRFQTLLKGIRRLGILAVPEGTSLNSRRSIIARPTVTGHF